MKTFLRNTLAALVVASAGVAASAPAATAGDVGFSFSIGSANSAIMVRSDGRRGDRGWDRFERPRHQARSECKPRKALRKARNMGLNRTHIVRDNHRRVVVEGARHGRWMRVAFANQRHCPVISVRR
ncbi:hypothetical protein OEG84_09480 [Hoeflea sp. G2-23]|uniref:Antifreeze protein n=1 Tax=Hoeflea algicola TaxID=2983763 RepID=A0ABT3Z9B8_9HYPH|nr:hypothetical protein [Hoeflea algicola]MCY0147934.1 hypothetical protein [Hoeflea algicola]